MIKNEENQVFHKLTAMRLLFFPDGRIYNYSKTQFIKAEEIPNVTIKGGIIADEAGKGKTIQLLSLCSVRNIPTLVLVPNHLKTHWVSELSKHFTKSPCIEIVGFDDYDFKMLEGKARIVVDEIHLIYSDDRYSRLYDMLCRTKALYKWGITATPFTGKNCIHKIVQFLTDQQFLYQEFERYTHYSDLFIRLFRRNVGKNIMDEIQLPPLEFQNHILDFNEIEKSIYESERSANQNSNEMDLRIYCCDVMTKFGNTQVMNEDTLRTAVLDNFRDLYEVEKSKLEVLKQSLERIKAQENQEEQRNNRMHYEQLIRSQDEVVRNREIPFNMLTTLLKEQKECAICCMEITGNYCILKKCIHYNCEVCLKSWLSRSKICPTCRSSDVDYFLMGNSQTTNPYSTKIMKLLEIIKESKRRIIVFTQFERIISKLIEVLSIEGISAREFDEKNIEDFRKSNFQVLILSSKNNACGLDLSFISDIVIFEPIAGNYVKDVEKQIVARIHRINQVSICKVHRLIIRNTIEETIYQEFL